MKFSVIIPFRNNRHEVLGLLKTIEQQSYTEPFETIVVDQSDIKEAPIEMSRVPYRWFHMEGSGAARSRNMAIKHAVGDYIVWGDSDARFKKNTLQNIDRITEDNPDYDLICGIYLNIEDGKPYSRYSGSKTTPMNFKNYDCCLGSAMVIKRTILDKVGLLDESLGTGTRYGSSEETDLVLRILEYGGKLLYEPDHEVFHPRLDPKQMSLRSWTARHYRYGMGRGAMLRKHLQVKPAWALGQLTLALLRPAAGVLMEILRLQGRQALRYAVSIVGRLHGFASYKP